MCRNVSVCQNHITAGRRNNETVMYPIMCDDVERCGTIDPA